MNILKEYQNERQLNNPQLAEKAGLSLSNARRIMSLTEEALLKMPIDTAIRIRQGTGVDFIEHIEQILNNNE